MFRMLSEVTWPKFLGIKKCEPLLLCRRLAKSALVLIPLFGVPYMLFLGAQRYYISEEMELVKLYFEMTFNSFNVRTISSIIIISIIIIVIIHHAPVCTDVSDALTVKRPHSKPPVEAAVILRATPARRSRPPSLTHSWTELICEISSSIDTRRRLTAPYLNHLLTYLWTFFVIRRVLLTVFRVI